MEEILAKKWTYQNTYIALIVCSTLLLITLRAMMKLCDRPTGIGRRPCAPPQGSNCNHFAVFFTCYMYTQNHGLRYHEMAVRVPPPIQVPSSPFYSANGLVLLVIIVILNIQPSSLFVAVGLQREYFDCIYSRCIVIQKVYKIQLYLLGKG